MRKLTFLGVSFIILGTFAVSCQPDNVCECEIYEKKYDEKGNVKRIHLSTVKNTCEKTKAEKEDYKNSVKYDFEEIGCDNQ